MLAAILLFLSGYGANQIIDVTNPEENVTNQNTEKNEDPQDPGLHQSPKDPGDHATNEYLCSPEGCVPK